MARCRVRLWDNDYVLEQFAKLYSEIFLFYNNALDWYGSNWGWISKLISVVRACVKVFTLVRANGQELEYKIL